MVMKSRAKARRRAPAPKKPAARPRKRGPAARATDTRPSWAYRAPRPVDRQLPPGAQAASRSLQKKQPRGTVGKRMGFATPSVSATANVKPHPAYRNPAGGTLRTATHPANDPTGARARVISPSGTGKRQGPGKGVPGVTYADWARGAAKRYAAAKKKKKK